MLSTRCCGASSSVSETTKPPAFSVDSTSGRSGPAVSLISTSTSSSPTVSSVSSESTWTSSPSSSTSKVSSSKTSSSSTRSESVVAAVSFLPFLVAAAFAAVACFGVVVTQVLFSLGAVCVTSSHTINTPMTLSNPCLNNLCSRRCTFGGRSLHCPRLLGLLNVQLYMISFC